MHHGQARGEGEGKGGGFPGPRDVWGTRHRSKILKRVFQMVLSDLKYAFSAGALRRTPLAELTTLPQTLSRMIFVIFMIFARKLKKYMIFARKCPNFTR